MPASVRLSLEVWEVQAEQVAVEMSQAYLRHCSELLESQKARWRASARRASRGEPGLMARLRCLRLARRYEVLCRKLDHLRMTAASAERRAVEDLELARTWQQRVELDYWVCIEGTSGLPVAMESAAAVGRGGVSRPRQRLEELVGWVLNRRTQLALEKQAALGSHIEGLQAYLRDVRRQTTARPDIVVLMRNRYALNAKEWPSLATERAILASLNDCAAELTPLLEALVQRHSQLQAAAAELRQMMRLRLERLSRFVVPPTDMNERTQIPLDLSRERSLNIRLLQGTREVAL